MVKRRLAEAAPRLVDATVGRSVGDDGYVDIIPAVQWAVMDGVDDPVGRVVAATVRAEVRRGRR